VSLLAHSARYGFPEQTYKEHATRVRKLAKKYASSILPYISFGDLFMSTVCIAAEYHDMGKLESANQEVLRKKPLERLPVHHEDAGTAFLLKGRYHLSALCVFSHHKGLPSIVKEENRPHCFRNCRPIGKGEKTVMYVTDENLAEYVEKHSAEISVPLPKLMAGGRPPGPSFLRMALSCIVDADHTDTAEHYGGKIDTTDIPLSPLERLGSLNAYINLLPTEDTAAERLAIRQKFYRACMKEPETRGLYSCSMPVGTGKTTSVMAHLLKAAECFGLRRIFVVLPFTNIIDQSVKTYRQSLVLSSENSEAVVAAHHHRAEYKNPKLMASSFLWNAPVTVTTAVQFFETLAANWPASLRKLHNLAGSAIFIDEAHAALQADLWPQAWKWLQDLVQNWGCHIVLGSGSLSHFWKLPEFSETNVLLPEIAGKNLYQEAAQFENNRIAYRLKKSRIDVNDLYHWVVEELPGPRIVIMNTVQSAAALAMKIADNQGRHAVEHLSTALAPIHRAVVLRIIRCRLKRTMDKDWTLVATTCAEAGLNFSFRSAARELSSLASAIQVGGRVNRQCEYGPDCIVWCFRIKADDVLRDHPNFRASAAILEQLFDEGKVSPDFCTEAIIREIRTYNRAMAKDDPIVCTEKAWRYPEVSELFKVIDEGEAYTVVIDPRLQKRLEAGERATRKDMQNLTVRMRKRQIDYLGLPEIRGYEDLFFCPPEFYNRFIGYMLGILRVISTKPETWIA